MSKCTHTRAIDCKCWPSNVPNPFDGNTIDHPAPAAAEEKPRNAKGHTCPIGQPCPECDAEWIAENKAENERADAWKSSEGNTPASATQEALCEKKHGNSWDRCSHDVTECVEPPASATAQGKTCAFDASVFECGDCFQPVIAHKRAAPLPVDTYAAGRAAGIEEAARMAEGFGMFKPLEYGDRIRELIGEAPLTEDADAHETITLHKIPGSGGGWMVCYPSECHGNREHRTATISGHKALDGGEKK